MTDNPARIMPLTLLAISLNERPLSPPISAFFDAHGGTIGRADHNALALPDPDRHISRLQAEVVASGDDFLIRNVGGSNPIVVAGHTVARGGAALLAHGDEVRIGGYLLKVDRLATGPATSPAIGPSTGPAPDAAAAPQAALRPQSARPGATAAADFDSTEAAPLLPASSTHASAHAGVASSDSADQTVVFAKTAVNEGVLMQRLWDAFCEGAEISLPLGPLAAPERMREVGRVLRSAVDGTLRLMAVRASTKNEFGADVTVIRGQNNNPLKFSPDVSVALSHLLQPPVQGFLPGPAAMDDAMLDLVGHSAATVAGMRAAVTGMLDRFSPQALETKLAGNSVLHSLLPAARKSKLWDAYLQHHGSIRSDAQEDFQTLFGKAFLDAYDQQVAQLRRKPLA